MSKKVFLVCSALLLSSWVGQANAALTVWNIDSSQSYVRINIPNQPVVIPGFGSQPLTFHGQATVDGQPPLTPLVAWTDSNKKLAAVQGTLSTNYVEGVSVQFNAGSHSASLVESGTFAPDRNSWNGSNLFGTRFPGTPAAFAMDVALGGANRLIKANMYNINMDTGGTASLAGGGPWTGSGNLSGVGSTAGTTLDLDFNLPGAAFGIPDTRETLGSLMSSVTLGTNGTLNINAIGSVREMIYTFNVPFTIDIVPGVVQVNASYEGSIRATVPEPASVSLVGIALGLCAFRRRRSV